MGLVPHALFRHFLPLLVVGLLATGDKAAPQASGAFVDTTGQAINLLAAPLTPGLGISDGSYTRTAITEGTALSPVARSSPAEVREFHVAPVTASPSGAVAGISVASRRYPSSGSPIPPAVDYHNASFYVDTFSSEGVLGGGASNGIIALNAQSFARAGSFSRAYGLVAQGTVQSPRSLTVGIESDVMNAVGTVAPRMLAGGVPAGGSVGAILGGTTYGPGSLYTTAGLVVNGGNAQGAPLDGVWLGPNGAVEHGINLGWLPPTVPPLLLNRGASIHTTSGGVETPLLGTDAIGAAYLSSNSAVIFSGASEYGRFTASGLTLAGGGTLYVGAGGALMYRSPAGHVSQVGAP